MNQQPVDHIPLMILLGAADALAIQCASLQKAFKQFQEKRPKRHEDHVTNLQAKPLPRRMHRCYSFEIGRKM